MRIFKTVLQIVAGLALAAGAVFLTQHVAIAFNWCCKWGSSSATYKYDSSLPSSYQSATNLGASEWTNVTSSSWTWYYSSSSGNPIKYGGVDGAGGILAVTTIWRSGGTILNIEIKYDSAENWYTGTGTPAGNQFDLWSTAAHEFGHALGLDHATPNVDCPGLGAGQYDATMCNGQAAGQTYKRSLEGDDRNGVTYLYP